MNNLMTIKQASVWASKHLNRQVTTSNISCIIQYGKIKKYDGNGSISFDLNDLKRYYNAFHGKRELKWKKREEQNDCFF